MKMIKTLCLVTSLIFSIGAYAYTDCENNCQKKCTAMSSNPSSHHAHNCFNDCVVEKCGKRS